MPRFIAPAGTPVTFRDLAGWITDTLRGKDRRDDLREAIKSKYDVKHCFLMSSGRAAMAMLFRILKENNKDTERTEIVLPSYTCYSVPAAAELAGLKVRICDIDPRTLSYDMEQFRSIDLSRVLCVVTANLYGFPNDLEQLETVTRTAGCYLLDDAAQSMNAMVNQRYAGTFGDVGLFSLDKGKNITSIQGGIIVTNNDEIASWVENAINDLPSPSISQQLSDAIKIIIYVLMLKPYFYWIPANIPALGLGRTIYTTDYLFSKYSRSLSALSWRLFCRVDEISRQRAERAAKILKKIESNKDISTIHKINDSALPVYLRTPVLINSSRPRANIVAELRKIGIGATCSYPASIADLEEVRPYSVIHNGQASAGQYIASHIVTLPSLPYLSDNDIQKIGLLLNKTG